MIKTVESMLAKWPPEQAILAGAPQFCTAPPRMHFLDRDLAITLGEVVYRDRYGRIWRIPAGAPVNGMSYVWPASWIWDRWAEATLQPMILHDVSYGCHDYMRGWDYDRREIDLNLVDGLRVTDPAGARLRFLAVRLGGEGVWREKKPDELFERWLEAVAAGRLEEFIEGTMLFRGSEKRGKRNEWMRRR